MFCSMTEPNDSSELIIDFNKYTHNQPATQKHREHQSRTEHKKLFLKNILVF